MRTTLDIDETLYRRVKAKAAMEGKTVTELVEAGLRTLIEAPKTSPEPPWKRFAGAWSGPEWEKDRHQMEAAIETEFGQVEQEDQMTPEEVEASWKPQP